MVGTVAGSLGKLGSDPTQAVLNLAVTPAKQPWRGGPEHGQRRQPWERGMAQRAVLQKPTLLTDGDIFQFTEHSVPMAIQS